MADKNDTNLLTEITALERQVWDALVTGDINADAALLCDSFLGVYSDGFAQKADHTGQLISGPTVESYTISSCHLRPLGSGHVMFSYQADFTRAGAKASETMYVTSVWALRAGAWINIFSQDTPAKPNHPA